VYLLITSRAICSVLDVVYVSLLSPPPQNVLRAERAGVIKAVNKKAGAHLKVDEVIIEFE
jgi:hypothetical protein